MLQDYYVVVLYDHGMFDPPLTSVTCGRGDGLTSKLHVLPNPHSSSTDVPDNSDPLHGRLDPQGHVVQSDAPDRSGGDGRQVSLRVGFRAASARKVLG